MSNYLKIENSVNKFLLKIIKICNYKLSNFNFKKRKELIQKEIRTFINNNIELKSLSLSLADKMLFLKICILKKRLSNYNQKNLSEFDLLELSNIAKIYLQNIISAKI